MPYKCIGSNLMHDKGGWKIKQHCKSHLACISAMKLMYGIEHGMTPRSRKHK